jgi:hypothetical protein
MDCLEKGVDPAICAKRRTKNILACFRR